MSQELELVAIISPAPGKADRVIEVMSSIAKIVHEKEPGTLRYQFFKQTGDDPKVFVLEKYKDGAALKAHGRFPEFQETSRILMKEKLVSGPAQIYVLRSAAGFASRL